MQTLQGGASCSPLVGLKYLVVCVRMEMILLCMYYLCPPWNLRYRGIFFVYDRNYYLFSNCDCYPFLYRPWSNIRWSTIIDTRQFWHSVQQVSEVVILSNLTLWLFKYAAGRTSSAGIYANNVENSSCSSLGWTFSEITGSHLDLIKPNCKGSVTIYGEINDILLIYIYFLLVIDNIKKWTEWMLVNHFFLVALTYYCCN